MYWHNKKLTQNLASTEIKTSLTRVNNLLCTLLHSPKGKAIHLFKTPKMISTIVHVVAIISIFSDGLKGCKKHLNMIMKMKCLSMPLPICFEPLTKP